jgi:hypothetical protein
VSGQGLKYVTLYSTIVPESKRSRRAFFAASQKMRDILRNISLVCTHGLKTGKYFVEILLVSRDPQQCGIGC